MRVAALLALACAAAAAPAQANPVLACTPYGDYVVCADGRAYIAPEAIGRYVRLPGGSAPAPAVAVTAPADERAFAKLLGAFEREARQTCIDLHRTDPARRPFCERQQIAEKVRATDDPIFIAWWSAGGAR